MNNHLVFYVPEEVPEVSVHRYSGGSLPVTPKLLRVRQSADAQLLGAAEVWLPLSHLPWYRIHRLTVEQIYQREKEGSRAVMEYELATEAGYTTRHQTLEVGRLGCRLISCYGFSNVEQSAPSMTRQ